MLSKYNSGFYMPALVLFIGLGVGFFVSAFGIYKKNNLVGNYNHLNKIAYFNGQTSFVPKEIIENEDNLDVLGSKSEKKEKRIEVDLSKQKLYAYEGSKKKFSFDVSTGKWNLTPTGEFRIWTKLKYTLMTGGSKDNNSYYYLPNVPFTMYFYKDYGIHGAYWHDNFGHPMSHGCVNMRPSEAEKLFYWANPVVPKGKNSVLSSDDNKGTKVIIYGKAPKN